MKYTVMSQDLSTHNSNSDLVSDIYFLKHKKNIWNLHSEPVKETCSTLSCHFITLENIDMLDQFSVVQHRYALIENQLVLHKWYRIKARWLEIIFFCSKPLEWTGSYTRSSLSRLVDYRRTSDWLWSIHHSFTILWIHCTLQNSFRSSRALTIVTNCVVSLQCVDGNR